MTPEELPRGRAIAVSAQQAREARAAIDTGTSISAAARALGVSRAALNRALDREHLSNKDVFAETAAMKLQVARMQAELEQLRSWRDQALATAPHPGAR